MRPALAWGFHTRTQSLTYYTMLNLHHTRPRRQRSKTSGQGRTMSMRSKYRTLSGLYFLCAFLICAKIFALWATALAAGTRPGVSMKRTRMPLMDPSSTCTCNIAQVVS